jgi:hypothetical protein
VITKEHNVDAFDVVSHIGNSNKKSPLIHSTANGRDTDDATIATAGGFAEQVKALHSSFYQLDEALLVDYVKARPNLAQRLGGTHTEWKIKEVGDGNLNLVFIVLGPKGSFVLKQVRYGYFVHHFFASLYNNFSEIIQTLKCNIGFVVRVYCCFLFMLLVCLISNLFFCPSN